MSAPEKKPPYKWPSNWPDGAVGPNRDVILRVAGKRFRCECGANVFQHPATEPDVYRCNGCGTEYSED